MHTATIFIISLSIFPYVFSFYYNKNLVHCGGNVLSVNRDVSLLRAEQAKIFHRDSKLFSTVDKKKFSSWPCGDKLDNEIIKLAVPAILNLAIIPLVGAVDTFWVGRMSNALALAGQGAANQIFGSTFYLISFLPSIVTPLVAKAASSGNKTELRQRIGEACFIGSVMGCIGSSLLYFLPEKALSLVLPPRAPSFIYARPYLTVRALTFWPAVLSNVCFAAFRGTLDFITPLKITIISNIVNIIFDPLMIFRPLGMGVAGAAAATCLSELAAFLLYMKEMASRDMIRMSTLFRVPPWKDLKPLLLGGLTVQLRSIAITITFLALQRATQALDSTGVSAAAYAITTQFWQLGGIILLALSTVTATVIPTVLARAKLSPEAAMPDVDHLLPVKQTADRLLLWGLVLGVTMATLQVASLPMLKVFTGIPEVLDAARMPALLVAFFNCFNGVVFVGEGIMLGNQDFTTLGVTTFIGTVGLLTSLKFFGDSLVGVFGSLLFFNFVRLTGVLRYHFFVRPFSDKSRKLTETPQSVAQLSV